MSILPLDTTTRGGQRALFLGGAQVHVPGSAGEGSWVEREGERFFRIADYDALPPFLMSVVSGHDHWLFVSSSGGLTCGRRAPESGLFPYCTDDKLHDAHETTGPVTALLVTRGGKTSLWRPFAAGPRVYDIERNLDKNVPGTELVFEELNHDLELGFSYSWTTSDRFGFVRRARLENRGTDEVHVELVDGLRNLLPAGVDRGVQSELSTLLDAYKQAEVVPGVQAAIYSLTSILTDRAEPSEALSATMVWSAGLEDARVLLAEDGLRDLLAGRAPRHEQRSHGKRGAFLLHAVLDLEPRDAARWQIVADVEYGPAQVANLVGELRGGLGSTQVERDIAEGLDRVQRLVGAADGFQGSTDERVAARHFSNTLFNIMRGGVFPHGYEFPREDFLAFVGEWNAPLRARVEAELAELEGTLDLFRMRAWAEQQGDADCVRLVHEYLPLTFSRRHGDPSRPWNHFCIELEGPAGEERLAYQGNWRDIFQNWEALALSYPEYIESFVVKFLNASTADGYNPYRISRLGIEWEEPEPDQPWSNIGYWGDHQVVYLMRLLELSLAYHPGRLATWMERAEFVSADVPYRIKPFAELLRDPRDSVEFDEERARAIARRVEVLGADGKLVAGRDGAPWRVTLTEKLLLVALVRLGNLVPGGGIWMNTQRPEWNDANNALVGYGLSMVTLYHLRRFLGLLRSLLEEAGATHYTLSSQVAELLADVGGALRDHSDLLDGPWDAAARRGFMEAMGAACDVHRAAVYGEPRDETTRVETLQIAEVVELALDYLDHSIGLARREDGLYQAYNLMRFEAGGVEVEPLQEMLEGQVAVLSSGYLSTEASLELLEALRVSRLYRADQNSYVLYPSRELPSFLEKNLIPSDLADASPVLNRLVAEGRGDYVVEDAEGRVHFQPEFRNASVLREALARDPRVTQEEAQELAEVYEAVFEHRAFTGRSGSMVKYEGLGCIYWHMVSKLLLAVAEVFERALDEGAEPARLQRLAERFRDVQDGLGVHKRPAQYGAFPIDAYSHTPSFMGVQQPGLTGQVKEDVITRFRELGARVEGGELRFEPRLLRREELSGEPSSWTYSTGGELGEVPLAAGTLAFTLCGVPVHYRLGDAARLHLFGDDGATLLLEGSRLGLERSRALFSRSAGLERIEVEVPGEALR